MEPTEMDRPNHLQVISQQPPAICNRSAATTEAQAKALVFELWRSTKHTKDQDDGRLEIFSLWVHRLTGRPIAQTAKAIGILTSEEEWWPATATFERAYKASAPKHYGQAW